MMPKTLLDEPLLLGRRSDGTPFALRDICPHRGMPLHYGTFDGREIECCYRGWRYDAEGQCTAILSLPEDRNLDVSRVTVRRYPYREIQGNIWVFMGSGDGDLADIPAVGRNSPK